MARLNQTADTRQTVCKVNLATLKVTTMMTVRKTRPEEFEDRIIFMSMFNDIDWTTNGYKDCFFRILKWQEITQGNFRWDIGLFAVLVMKEN